MSSLVSFYRESTRRILEDCDSRIVEHCDNPSSRTPDPATPEARPHRDPSVSVEVFRYGSQRN